MRTLIAIPALATALVLGGCGGDTVYHSDYHDDPYYDGPRLEGFDLVDSFGHDTALGDSPMEFDPYVDHGWFEVYWYTDTYRDYIVEYLVNDEPRLAGSTLIHSEYCGDGLPCGRDGVQSCQYNPDFTLSCGLDSPVKDIGFMFNDVPERLYFFIQVCGLAYTACEYDYYPALFF